MRIDPALKALSRRVKLAVGRAVLQLVDDARKLQSVQVVGLRGEVLDEVERFQQYGFTSHPHPKAECVVLSVGGMRQHPIVIAIDDRRYRLIGLEEGEVGIYTDEDLVDAPDDDATRPHRIVLKRGRVVEIHADEILLSAANGASTIRMNSTDILIDAPHVGVND